MIQGKLASAVSRVVQGLPRAVLLAGKAATSIARRVARLVHDNYYISLKLQFAG